MRRWEALPLLKWAELLRGVVYLRGPVTWRRGVLLADLAGWSGIYCAAIPQCEGALNVTWLVNDENVTQPFVSVRIAPTGGGQSWDEGEFAGGAPEFAAEAFDADQLAEMALKVDIYQEAGVRDYVAVLLEDQEVRWHTLQDGKFTLRRSWQAIPRRSSPSSTAACARPSIRRSSPSWRSGRARHDHL